jgi:hypothetical protein
VRKAKISKSLLTAREIGDTSWVLLRTKGGEIIGQFIYITHAYRPFYSFSASKCNEESSDRATSGE